MNPDPTSLDRLHDIVAPPPVPWWPPAPGWYWLLGAAGLAAVVFSLRLLLHWQRARYRREALAELRRQVPRLGDPEERATAIAALAELLKRTALSVWPRPLVASLSGPAWLAFLDRTSGAARFSTHGGDLLEQVAYDPRLAAGLDESTCRELAEAVRHWLRDHRAEGEEEQS